MLTPNTPGPAASADLCLRRLGHASALQPHWLSAWNYRIGLPGPKPMEHELQYAPVGGHLCLVSGAGGSRARQDKNLQRCHHCVRERCELASSLDLLSADLPCKAAAGCCHLQQRYHCLHTGHQLANVSASLLRASRHRET